MLRTKIKDGDLGPSKLDLHIKEKEDIKDIYKSKIVNFDEVFKELQRDGDILSEYNNNTTNIKKMFIKYIRDNVRFPVKIRIYTCNGSKTDIYKSVKNYLLHE